MARHAIIDRLNVLLLSSTYVYFAVFDLQLGGDLDAPAVIFMDRVRGV